MPRQPIFLKKGEIIVFDKNKLQMVTDEILELNLDQSMKEIKTEFIELLNKYKIPYDQSNIDAMVCFNLLMGQLQTYAEEVFLGTDEDKDEEVIELEESTGC